MLSRKIFTAAVIFAGALAASACSDNSARLVSAAPSPVTATASSSDRNSTSAVSVASEAMIQDPAVVAEWAASVGWAAVDFEARGIGDISAVSGSCSTTVTFTVLGVPVTTDSSTIFANGACADVAVGRRVDIRARLAVSGGTLTVLATRVEFVNAGEVEFEGRVQTVTGTCAAGLTITLATGKVVITNGTTVFDPSSSCSTIATNVQIEARGTLNSSGQLVATRVEVEGAGGEVTIDGKVQTVGGTGCPDRTLTLDDGTVVTTNSSTIFSPDGSCALIAAGARIRVRGTRTSPTAILASRVDLRDNGGRKKVAGEGTVASLKGTCPTLEMVVHGVRVTTDSSTTFENGECGNLRAGTKVVVEGDSASDRVLATKIRIVDQPGGKPVEGEGNVGGVKGTCPTLTMVVSGYPVMTTSTTTFKDGTCESIRPGSRISVKGTFDGGSVLATEVTVRSPAGN
jgi:hypothetical protein